MINKQGSKILATVLVFILFFTSFQGLFLDVKVKSSVRDQLLASTDKVDAPGSSVSPVTLADSPSSSSGAIDFATGTSPTATTTTSPNLITASSFIGAAPDISTDLPPASTISIPITAQAPGESVSEALQKTGFFDQFSMDTDLFLKMFGTDKKTVEADMNRLAGNTDEPGMDTDTSIAASDDTDSNIDLAPNSYLASNPITQGTIDTPDYSAWDGIFVSTYPIELTDDSYNKDVIAEGRLPKDFPPGVSWAQNQTNFPYFYHRYDAEGKKMDPSKMPTVALAAYNFYGSNSDIISNQDFQAICADTTQYKITYFPENRMFTSFGSFNPKYKRTILGAFEKNTYLGKIWNNTGDVYKDYWDPYYDEETYKFFDFKFQDYSKNNAIVLSTTTDTGYGGIYNWKATPKDTNRQYAVINLLALGGPKSKLNVKINFKDSLNHDYNYSWTSLDESKSEPLRYLDYDVPDILHTVSENYILDSDNTLTQVVDRYGNVTSGEAEVDMPFYDGKYAPGRTFKLYTLYIPAEYIQYTLDSFEFSTSYAYDPIYIMAISGKQIGSIKPRLDDDYTKFEYYLLGPTAGPGVDTTIRQTDKTSSTATVEWNALKKYTSILKNNKFTDYVLRVHEFTVAGYTFDENTMTEIPQGTTGNLYKVATIKGADENADTQTYSYKIEGLERGKVYKVYLSTVFGGMESYPINGEGNFIFTKPMNKVVYDQGLPTGYEIITGSSTWPTSSTLYADTDYVTLPGAPTGWKVKSPSNAEYAFKGWVTSSGQFFSAGQQVPITSTAIEKGIATFTAVWANSASSLAETPSGSGTQSDPYQISTAGNLLWMMARSVEELSGSFDGINYHYKYYKLMTDIDMQNIDPTIVSPIGGFIAHAKDTDTHIDATSLFSAGNNGGVANNMVSYIVFDGNYRTISNYSMVENNYTITEDVRTAGLFGNLYASIVKDLTISNMNIHFEHFYKTASGSTAENNTYIFIGGVAGIFHDGTNNNSRITNTQVNGGNIWGRAYRVYAGGLVGQYMSSGFTLEKLGNEADVSGIGTTGNSGGADTISKATVGGLFGRVLYLNTDSYVLQNSYNTGKVYGTSKYTAFVGGLIGRTEMDSVVNSAYTEIVYENLYNSGVVQYEKYHYDYSDYGYAGTLFGRIATPYKNDDPTTKGTWFNNLFYRNEAGALIYGPLSSTHLNKTDIVNVAPEWLTGFTDVRLNYNASGSYSAYNASNNLVSNKGQDLSNLKNDSSVPQPYSATMSLADLKTLNTYYSVADETYKFDTTVWKLVEGQLPELQYSGPNIIEFYPGDRSFTLAKGDTRVITPYARLKPDYTPSSDWEWTSSNPSLLTVNSNGALNLLDDSSTTPVTITLSSKSATPAFTAQTAVVTPVKVRATGIHLSVKSGLSSDPTVSLATYETPLSNFDIYVQPISATIDTFTLKMEDTSIAYIDNVKKVIVAVKPGTTKLIATSTDGNYKAEIPFTVTPILTKSIAISVQKIFPNEIPNNIIKIKSYDYLYVKKLSTMVTSEKADAAPSIPRLEWTSSDDSVAYVMEDGTVIGAREGTTTIRATATDGSGVYGEITIEVTSDRVSDIIPLVSNTPRVLYGSTTQLYVQVVTSTEGVEPLNKKLIWSSSDPSIASVDQRGFVKVFQDVDAGKVTITAKSEENPAVTEAFQPYSYKKPTSIRLLDSADYARMGQDRTVALGVYQVLPEDVELNPNDIIIESSDSSIVQVVKDATTGEYLVKSGQKTGTAFVRAKIRGTMLSDAAKVNVLQNIKVLVTVKDEDNQPLNGVSIDAEGVTYITGTNPDLLPGQAEVIVMPDVPTLTVKFTKEGYKSVDTLEGLMLKGTYSLIMKRKAPGDDMPYYKMAMVIDGKDQTFDILNSNHPTDKRKKSKVYATVDWGDFEAPVMNFIKGPGKMTIGPNYLDVYRTPGQFYYNFFSNNIGIFDSKAVPLNPDGTENTSHALSKVLTWDVADYDHRYDDIDLNSATMDAVLTESFGMQLPDRVPMKFTITGDHFVGAYYYTSQTDKLNGDGSVSQEVIADSNMADEIEYWINTGKKTANIDKNMQAPKDKKVEKRYNASVTVMGYIVGDFAYRTEIQELKDAGALGYLGDRLISRAEYEAYLSNYPNRKVPVPMMYLNISKGGLMSSSADSTKGQVYAQNPENLVVEVCLGASYYERLKFQSSYGVVQFNGQTKMQNYYAIRAAYSTTGLWEIGATVSGSSWVITTYPKPRQKKVYETMDFDIFGRYLMLKVTIPMGHYESKPLYTIYPDKDRSYGLYSANESLQNYASTPAPSEATVSSRVDYYVYANYN